MPAAEPGREVDDWGRSQRVFDLVEPLLDFYYRYWFRVEVEGVENVPSEGGALIVSNHSGALPPDAPMIMQAIRHEHPSPRPLYMLGENWFKGYPGVGMLANKIGLVGAHPANAQRLLGDEGRLVLVFPEGQKGSRKLFWQRYKLRRFGRGGFVRTAMRAGVPIVPTAVIGAEEAMPIFAHVPLLQRLTGLIYFPINHAFPHFGAAAGLMYLPAKFRIRFLEPIDLSAYGPRMPTTSRWSVGSRSASDCGFRRSWTTWYWRASPSGSGKLLCCGDEGSSLHRAGTCRSRDCGLRRRGLQERGPGPGAPCAHGRDPGRQGHRLARQARRRPGGDHDLQPDRQRAHDHARGRVDQGAAGTRPPGDTATIQKTLDPGSYEVRAGSKRAVRKEIQPAVLTIGKERKNSNNDCCCRDPVARTADDEACG